MFSSHAPEFQSSLQIVCGHCLVVTTSDLALTNIANVFYLAGFIESWGRGIEKIFEACKSADLPMPEFIVHPSDIMVKFTAPADRVVHGPGRVTDGEKAILELLEVDPGYTYATMAEILKISRKTVSERIKKLKEKEIIIRIGSDTKGYWRILK